MYIFNFFKEAPQMKIRILSYLNVEEQEKVSVLLFLLQSVFLGFFYGAFDVGAHALFLDVYPDSMIPKAYVVSGLVGIIFTSAYTKLQNVISFKRLAILNFLFIALITSFLRLGFLITDQNWLIFAIFIMMGPLNIIALLGFWGNASRIFTLRQGKRLFGLIDAGQIIGVILSSYAIPILLAVGFLQINLFFISAVSILLALLVQFLISFRFSAKINVEVKTQANSRKEGLLRLLKSRYILLMAIFVILSMLSAFFIQYSFLVVAKSNYPDTNALASFFGLFTGSLMLFTLLFKTLVYGRLMKAYGLKTSLMLSAFILGIFTIAACLIGSLLGYGPESTGFMFFFLIISLSRLFSKALKDGVEVPSFKLLYQSLKESIRYDVQAYIDGTINEIAALSAGLLLLLLSMLEFFRLIHFSYVLFGLLLAWFFISRRLYLYYRRSLEDSLSSQKQVKTDEGQEQFNISLDVSNDSYTDLYMKYILFKGSFLEEVEQSDRNHFNTNLVGELAFKEYEIKLIDKLVDSGYLSKNGNEQYNKIIKELKSKDHKNVEKLFKSNDKYKKVLSLYFIREGLSDDKLKMIKSASRDSDYVIKRETIKTIGAAKVNSLINFVVDQLDDKFLFQEAVRTLLDFSDQSVDAMKQAFHKTDAQLISQLRIIEILTRLETQISEDFLLSLIDHPVKQIRHKTYKSLCQIGFKTDITNENKFLQKLEDYIGIIAWNIAVFESAKDNDGSSLLLESLKEEMTENFDTLYHLLSLLYKPESVTHVRENLEVGTTEGVNYALELLDLFVHDSIKPRLFPILEDITNSEKIRVLEAFYPVEKTEGHEYLVDLINRDINELNNWIKVSAILNYLEIDNLGVSDDIIAHIFNPTSIVREAASFTVKEKDREVLINCQPRLKEEEWLKIEETIELSLYTKNHFLFEKVLFLKKCEELKNVKYNLLANVAEKIQDIHIDKDKDFKIFDKDDFSSLYFLKEGKLIVNYGDDVLVFNEGAFFVPEQTINNKDNVYHFESDYAWIYQIKMSDLINVGYDNSELFEGIQQFLIVNRNKYINLIQ